MATRGGGDRPRGGFISKDHGTFMTVQMPDGSYGYVLRDGTVRGGFRSPSGATLSGKRAVEVKFRARLGELGLDPGESVTDTLLGYYRRRVEGVFSRAEDEMRVKLDGFMRKYEEDRLGWEERVASGKATQEAFDSWLAEQARQQGRMTGMADRLAQTLADADSVAVGAINGYLPSAYAENFNYATYQVESGTGVATSFTLYDPSTVARLLRDDPKLLPERRTDEGRDLAWNRRKVTEAVTQGILQGESVDKVAGRLKYVLDMDRRAALRAARTALTGAQNAGRVDAYARAKDMGIDLRQEWQATYDQRTRHTHAALDGEQVEVGEAFSNGLRYPGDPDGPPAEVYNCRCTLVPVLGGLDDGGAWKRDVTIGDETYDQWKARHVSASTKSVEELRAEVEALENEVNELSRVAGREPSRAMLDYREERVDRLRRDLAEVEWAKDLDLDAERAENDRLMDMTDHITDLYDRLHQLSWRDPEYRRIQAEIDKWYDDIDESSVRLQGARDYARLSARLRDAEENLARERAAYEAGAEAYRQNRARLEDAVARRNRAYGNLSDVLPFAPDVRSKLGDGYADAMEAMVRDAASRHPEIAAAYRRFSCKLAVTESDLGDGAYYRPVDRGISFNAERTARGDDLDRPYQVAFHEFGHLIDNVSAYRYQNSSAMGDLQATINSDWTRFRNAEARRMGVRRDRNRAVVDMLLDERYGSSLREYGSLSDIVEGCTRIPYPLGAGHGVEYHRSGDNKTAAEFFAEVCDGAMANEESYRQLARVFPNAVATVEDMMRRMTS